MWIRITRMKRQIFRSSLPCKKTVQNRKLLICSLWFVICLNYCGKKNPHHYDKEILLI